MLKAGIDFQTHPEGRTEHRRKTGIFIWFGYRLPVPERLRLIREAGFETVLHWWDDSFQKEEGFTKEEQVLLIRREGLYIENAHLRIDRANDLWMDNLNGQTALEGYLTDIDGLAELEIPAAVLHPAGGFHPPSVSKVGMERFRALAGRAEKRGVKLALENVRTSGALTAVLDTVDSPMLGFCYDSGHDHVWSRTPYELLKRYGKRLFAVHLHDNNGKEDEHLAPGEGKVDWKIVREGIERSAYCGSFTLESDSAQIPQSRTPEEHLKMHFEGARSRLYTFRG